MAAPAPAGGENPYGLTAALRDGGLVAQITFGIMVIMSVGSWYIFFVKLFEQSKIIKEGRRARTVFWQSPNLREAANKLDKNGAYRQIVDDGLLAEEQHTKLTDPIDQHAMVDGFRMMRKIVDAAPMDAYRDSEFSPGPSVSSDEEILNWIRNNSQTAYHPIGTCRMGPAGPKTVVDDKLRVHGIEGLRVADASIFPTMPSGNTNAPSIMVGEKMADILKAA